MSPLRRFYADTDLATHVGIAELGEVNLFHLGPDGLGPIVMALVVFRKGRPAGTGSGSRMES